MRYLRYSLFLATTLLVTGCAELSAVNTKIGEIAGQINQKVYGANSNNTTVNHNGITIHKKSDALTSRQNIDKLFIKVRREFGFRPVEANSSSDKVYQAVPGVLYHVSGYFGYDEDSRGVSLGDNYLEVVLEKTDNNTVSVTWEASGSSMWIKRAEARLTKVIKN